MRRIHTTYDLLDAHVLTALLREHGIPAWLFDADFVRQNWFQSIAYGGYRILVRDEDVDAARALLREQRAGRIALNDDTDEHCPRCAHASVVDDPQPRRNVFLAFLIILALEMFADVALRAPRLSPAAILTMYALQIALNVVAPWLLLRYFKWRVRCTACGYRWRQPPTHTHAELSRMAADADGTPA